ncbi:hypothetical protein Tco_1518752 [Tanacetum coccineum]
MVVNGYDGLPMHPPSLDYAPGPEHPPSPIYISYVPDHAYPEFMPHEDDMLLAEEQPLPAAVSPTTDSPIYITESDPEEDPKEEDDEDPEDDPADYPTNRDVEEEEESSEDDADDEDGDEEEEHLAPADSVPLLAYHTIPTATRSSPLHMSPPPLPASPTHPLGYRAAMIRLRAESASTSHPLPLPIVLPHTKASMDMMRAAAPFTYILASQSETPPSGTPLLLPIPLPTLSPPLLLPSTDCRADVLEVTLPPQKRLCIAPGPRYKVGECSYAPTARPTGDFRADYGFVSTLDAEIRRDPDREIGYGIIDVWVDPDEIADEIPTTDVAELGKRMTNFVTTIRKDTYEIYKRLDDAHDDRLLMSGQLNLLRRDRRAHARIARLMKSETRASRKAWVRSIDTSDTTRYETQMAALQSQQTPARDLVHPDVQEEADSSS